MFASSVFAGLLASTLDMCLVPDLSIHEQNAPFAYAGFILRPSPLFGGPLAGRFPARQIHGLLIYRDYLGIVRYVPMEGEAVLVDQEDLEGEVTKEWVATVNGMGVQPPEAVNLPHDASHGVHQFQMRLRIPESWLIRVADVGTVGDPTDQIGWAWMWNELKRADDLGDDDFSPNWAPIWRVPCVDFIGPAMFDL